MDVEGGGGSGGGRETGGSFAKRGRGAITHTRSCGRGGGGRARRRCTPAAHGGLPGCSALREPRKVDCFFYFGDGAGRLFAAVVFVVAVKKVEWSALTEEASCGIEGFFFRQHSPHIFVFLIISLSN